MKYPVVDIRLTCEYRNSERTSLNCLVSFRSCCRNRDRLETRDSRFEIRDLERGGVERGYHGLGPTQHPTTVLWVEKEKLSVAYLYHTPQQTKPQLANQGRKVLCGLRKWRICHLLYYRRSRFWNLIISCVSRATAETDELVDVM